MSKCVFILDRSKSQCNFIALLGMYMHTCSKKKLTVRSFFQNSGLKFAGSGARKPQWEFEGSALKQFFHVVLRLNGALIVQLNYHIKASVILMVFGRGKSNHTLAIARCVFFYQHCFTKIIETYILL